MTSPLLLARAIYFATTAHLNDVDRADLPYILHPLDVLDRVTKVLPDDVEAQCAAVMHDVKEDHPTLWQLWRKRLTPRIESLVDNLSKRPEDDYESYIERIATSRNIPLIRIKMADLQSNIDRPCEDQVWKAKQVQKYQLALVRLNAVILSEAA